MDVPVVDYSRWLASLGADAFDEVAEAAERVIMIHEALANDGISLLGELLRDRGTAPIETWAHYPTDDCIDPKSGAMYYYHAHDPVAWTRQEHGHFHLFVRSEQTHDFSHLMAISMSPQGIPNRLFTTNGWVTDEVMLPAEELLRQLDEGWEIRRARPSWLVAQWLMAMPVLLRPQVTALLRQRDSILGWTRDGHASTQVLEDRNLHLLSEVPLDLVDVLEAVQMEAHTRVN